MIRKFRCRKEVFDSLRKEYDRIVIMEYKNDYLEALKEFNSIAEDELRSVLDKYYDSQTSRDQAWKSCKGALYEYAVFKYVEKTISNNENLSARFLALMGEEIIRYKDSIAIRNWSEIFPDVDILIVEGNQVRVIISCKTSLRERLTETAFWKRELERTKSTRDIKIVFITIDKDNELRQDMNRYILLHVLDCTFITDPRRYEELVNYFTQKYGARPDFNKLKSKIRFIEDFENFLLNQL